MKKAIEHLDGLYIKAGARAPIVLEVLESGLSINDQKTKGENIIPFEELTMEDIKTLEESFKALSEVFKKAEKPMSLKDIDAALEEYQQPDIQVVLLDIYAEKRISIEIEPPHCSMLGSKLITEIILPDTLTLGQFKKNIAPKILAISERMREIVEIL